MSYVILNRDDLSRDANTFEFEGIQYHNTELSFIWVDTPHKFMNTGDQPLRQVNIHVSMQIVTDWLED